MDDDAGLRERLAQRLPRGVAIGRTFAQGQAGGAHLFQVAPCPPSGESRQVMGVEGGQRAGGEFRRRQKPAVCGARE